MSSAGPYEPALHALRGTAFASIAYVEETESTNADAAELLGDPSVAGHTIVAEHQRRGAGRKGRTWHDAPGSALLFTTILPEAVPTERLWLIPYWTALGVRAGLLACGIDTRLQWPNDLLLADRKLAGILCVSRVTAAFARAASGIGINVHRNGDAYAAVDPPPAFCSDAADVARPALLAAILRAFDESLDSLDDVERVVSAWETAAGIPGRRYRIARDGDDAPFEGVALGLESGGGLRLRRDDGAHVTATLADARALR